jgi:hypothetical protein
MVYHHPQPGCAKSEREIAHALDGYYRDEHLFTLRQAVVESQNVV